MTKRTKKPAAAPRAKLKDSIAEKARKEKAATVDTVTASASDKPPALAAQALMQQLIDIASEETLITQRMAWKAFIEKIERDPGVQTILEVEQEVGQAVFAHAVKMTKVLVFQAIAGAAEPDVDQRTGLLEKAALIKQIDAIRITNPYEGNERDQ